MSYNLGGGECPPLQSPQPQHQFVSTSTTFTTDSSSPGSGLLLAPLPDGVLGLVREGGVPGPGLALPPAIVQITQPLSRAALSESVTALTSRPGASGDCVTQVTSVSLRSTPISIPARAQPQQLHSASVTLSRQTAASPLLEDDLGAGDYITLTSNNTALVFNSISATQSHDRGTSLIQWMITYFQDIFSEVPLDSITLDSDRGLDVESPVSLNTANSNTRVIFTSSLGSQSQTASGFNVSASGSGLRFPGSASISSGVSITSLSSHSPQPCISSTAQLVTISQGSISLPVVGVGHGGQLLTQSPASGVAPDADQFSSDPGYPGTEPLPTLMSPREVSLLSPTMTRDQMMSSTMMPRDQMLASNVNPMPKLMAVTDRKDQIMSSSRGSQTFLLSSRFNNPLSDQLLSTMISPTDAIISSPSQISSLPGELLATSSGPLSASQAKDQLSTISSPPAKHCGQFGPGSSGPLMSPLLSPGAQDSLPLSPSLGRDQLGPLSPSSPLQLPPSSPLPSQHVEAWDEDKSGENMEDCDNTGIHTLLLR